MNEKLSRLKEAVIITSTAESYKTLSQKETLYLAGLIDGDGTIYISRGRPTVSITSIHNYIVTLCTVYGGYFQYVERHRTRDKRPYYQWTWPIEMIKWYLPQILPYLQIKLEQAKILLEAIKLIQQRGTREERRNRKTTLKKYAKKLSYLNKEKAYPYNP